MSDPLSQGAVEAEEEEAPHVPTPSGGHEEDEAGEETGGGEEYVGGAEEEEVEAQPAPPRLTPEQESKLEIAVDVLKKSPPGELSSVIRDLEALLGSDLLAYALPSAMREYNITQFTPIQVPDEDRSISISTFNELDERTYADFSSGVALEVDHVTQRAVSSRPLTESEKRSSVETTRASVDKAISSYTRNHFPQGVCTTSATTNNEIVVTIVASKYNLDNYWVGRWRSVWKLNSSGSVEGNLMLNVHYFEDGNVQLNSSNTVTGKVEFGPGAGDMLAKLMKKEDAEFHNEVDETCGTKLNQTFKALRRKLPYTKEKFNFATSAHSLARELTKK